VLNFLSFDEYVLDLSPFMAIDTTVRYRLSDRYLHELFYPDMRHQWERENRVKMLAEGHSRIASPLYNLVNMTFALAAVLGATFSRFGYGRRIAIAAGAALVVRIVGFGLQAAAADAVWLNPLQYAAPVLAMIFALMIVFRSRLPAGRPMPVLRPAFRAAG
jgi:lipopolysaccharide export system permease protein